MMAMTTELDQMAETFRLIGHPLRLRILTALACGEHAVGDLVAMTAQSPSLISQQLALLRKGGLIQGRRDAKQVFYALAAAKMAEVALAVGALAGRDGGDATPTPEPPPETPRISAAMFARVQPRR